VACVPDGVALAAWASRCSARVPAFALDDVFAEALYRYKCDRWCCLVVILQRSLDWSIDEDYDDETGRSSQAGL
jgi:hypothetical protein